MYHRNNLDNISLGNFDHAYPAIAFHLNRVNHFNIMKETVVTPLTHPGNEAFSGAYL